LKREKSRKVLQSSGERGREGLKRRGNLKSKTISENARETKLKKSSRRARKKKDKKHSEKKRTVRGAPGTGKRAMV